MNVSLVIEQSSFQTRLGWLHFWLTLVILGALILCTIIGNVFVVAAILLEKHLQGVSNYLILSLAVADLMVATLPMPIAAVYEVSLQWWLGDAVCDFWICSDVLCCTASILHLVGIALDRYWAVTNAEYIRRRTARRISLMIATFWLLSLVISLPARFDYTRISNWISGSGTNSTGECSINKEYGYTIFSTVGAFYVPMLFMIGIYARIYFVARTRIRKSNFRKTQNSTELPSRSKGSNKRDQQSAIKSQSRVARIVNYCRICYKSQAVPVYLQAGQPITQQTYLTCQLSNTISSKAYHSPRCSELSRVNGLNTSSTKENLGKCQASLNDPRQNKMQQIQEGVCSFTRAESDDKPLEEDVAHVERKQTESLENLDPVDLAFIDQSLLSVYRECWNGICHSAPVSMYNMNVITTPTVSSVNSAESTDPSEEWSSFCSEIENRSKHSRKACDWSGRKKAICQMFRNLITRHSYSGQQMRRWKMTTIDVSRNIADTKVEPTTILELDKKSNESSHWNSDGPNVKYRLGQECVLGPLILANPTEEHLHEKPSTEIDDVSQSHTQGTTSMCVQPNLTTMAATLRRERLENKRERKAAMTLAIITGCFMLCWLPFFIDALISPFYETWQVSRAAGDIMLWLGYSNSLLNPIIYTIFSPDFREAFRKILFGRYYRWSREQ
uniref:5-hydroxytryptamine receptor 1A-4 n=1 Tax=Cryptocotyle lingua TaxID=66766 RepID=A0A7U0TID0_9TREM|nr:5-hydroxytryptamine receptor 1A-4 [Cryptocotyle lingua]